MLFTSSNYVVISYYNNGVFIILLAMSLWRGEPSVPLEGDQSARIGRFEKASLIQYWLVLLMTSLILERSPVTLTPTLRSYLSLDWSAQLEAQPCQSQSHGCVKKESPPRPPLQLYGQPLEYVTRFKLLGLPSLATYHGVPILPWSLLELNSSLGLFSVSLGTEQSQMSI